jgi:hypothetical protein
MRTSHEFSLELTAQELLDQPDVKPVVEVSNVDLAAMASALIAPLSSAAPTHDDELEIELTAEEIDKLLQENE